MQELCFSLGCDDTTLRPDNQVTAFLDAVTRGLAALDVDLLGMRSNPQRLRSAGFAAVQETVFKVPLGTWPRDAKMKTVGLYNRSMVYDGLHGVAMGPLVRGLKWAPEEVEVFLVGVRKGLMDSSQHGYLPFHVVVGQKPSK